MVEHTRPQFGFVHILLATWFYSCKLKKYANIILVFVVTSVYLPSRSYHCVMNHTHILEHRGTNQSYVPSHEQWWRPGQVGCHGDPVKKRAQECVIEPRCSRSSPGWIQVRSDFVSHLVDSTWVFSTHCKLICQSNRIPFEIYETVAWKKLNVRYDQVLLGLTSTHCERRLLTSQTVRCRASSCVGGQSGATAGSYPGSSPDSHQH